MNTARAIDAARKLGSAALHGDVGELLHQHLDDGYQIVQQGRIARAYTAGMTFADQVDDCDVASIRSGDVLLDDAVRWVHLKRARNSA